MIYWVYAEFSNVLGAFFDGCLSNVCPIMALVKRNIVNAHFLKLFTNNLVPISWKNNLK